MQYLLQKKNKLYFQIQEKDISYKKEKGEKKKDEKSFTQQVQVTKIATSLQISAEG